MPPEDSQITLLRAQLRDLHGDAFQARFSALMEHRHGSDFLRARAMGAEGDQGCDGYLSSKQEIFACYGALGGRTTVDYLCRKIREDFAKAKESTLLMQRWSFVHNLVDGLPTKAIAELKRLKKENPKIAIRSFGETEFQKIWPHAALHAPRLQRPKPVDSKPPTTDREWMDPRYTHIPLLGREEILNTLRNWLQGAGISVQVITAPGGSGKTRLAWELCRAAEKIGWDAGFLQQEALKQLLSHADPAAWN
ncbi:ATP-binding protein, partial [Candidatus Magnetaquicoccus inordinatus]|uniref:ATP-binding protein n=1 Tax=Candidatus Magnetaquicoccus inordinatus TaxID=2496818 RepID=UPI00102D12F5